MTAETNRPVVSAGRADKMDLQVSLVPGKGSPGGTPEVFFDSPVRELFALLQDEAVDQVLKDFRDLGDVRIFIQDNQALDCVIRARLRAALEIYTGLGVSS